MAQATVLFVQVITIVILAGSVSTAGKAKVEVGIQKDGSIGVHGERQEGNINVHGTVFVPPNDKPSGSFGVNHEAGKNAFDAGVGVDHNLNVKKWQAGFRHGDENNHVFVKATGGKKDSGFVVGAKWEF